MAKGYGRPPMGRKGGKGMGMGMPGLNMDMIKQAQKMQADMERTQAELQEKEYTATAGGGVVSATVDGKHTLKALTIDPEAVDPEDVEMLQKKCWHGISPAWKRGDTSSPPMERRPLTRLSSSAAPGRVRLSFLPITPILRKWWRLRQTLKCWMWHSQGLTMWPWMPASERA